MPHDSSTHPSADRWAPDQDALDRYLADECSEHETARFEQWLDAQPARARRLAAVWEATHLHARQETTDVDRLRERFWEQAQTTGRGAPGARVSRAPAATPRRTDEGRRRWFRTAPRTLWYGAAGVITSALLLFAVVWHPVGRQRSAPGMSQVITYTTKNGQRANITLPDGSTVALNVASRLDVPADFTRGNRTLRLTGEALFTVAHHTGAPFTVVAGQTAARVLGTTFTVRHYTTDTSTIVAVRDGKVAVRSAVLTANQQVDAADNGALRTGATDSSRFSFATGVLTFDWVPLPDAIVDLNRWYDVDIRIADPSLRANRIKATFAEGSRADLAAILGLALNARVVRDGRVLTLYPK